MLKKIVLNSVCSLMLMGGAQAYTLEEVQQSVHAQLQQQHMEMQQRQQEFCNRVWQSYYWNRSHGLLWREALPEEIRNERKTRCLREFYGLVFVPSR
jgi:hypothetical protein